MNDFLLKLIDTSKKKGLSWSEHLDLMERNGFVFDPSVNFDNPPSFYLDEFQKTNE